MKKLILIRAMLLYTLGASMVSPPIYAEKPEWAGANKDTSSVLIRRAPDKINPHQIEAVSKTQDTIKSAKVAREHAKNIAQSEKNDAVMARQQAMINAKMAEEARQKRLEKIEVEPGFLRKGEEPPEGGEKGKKKGWDDKDSPPGLFDRLFGGSKEE